MKQPTAWLHTATATYALFGILFGAGFVMEALWLDLYLNGLPVTARNILQALTVEPLHGLINTTPLFLGLLASVVGTWQDPLSRLNAGLSKTDEELWEQEERYRSLFENANDGIFIVSREGRFVAVNPKFVELTGIPQEELIGQTSEIFLPGGFAQSLERIERTIREGKLGPYEMEITTPLGTKVFSLNSFAYQEGGTPIGIMCIARDVTEERRRKEQEALYQLARELARSADIRTMTDHLFAQTQGVLGADCGFLLLADAEGKELRGVAACGIDSEVFRQERIDVRGEVTPVAQSFQQRRPVVLTDLAHSPLVSERLR